MTRKYFMINLHESMRPGRDRTWTPGSAGRLTTYCTMGPGVTVLYFDDIPERIL